MLYIVATPIGNLEDITVRALDILRNVDLVLAEDTRRSGVLLNHYKIKAKMISYNDMNKEKKTASVIKMLKSGDQVALISDAGTPGISDPGFYLVRECVKENIQISPIPGACALISGLVCSGLPTDKFSFFGFIPKKEGKKKEFFKGLSGTTVFYESPHRILKTLKMMNELIPDRQVVIARELTKKFEEFIRGSVSEVYLQLKDKNIKGEIVVIIN